MRTATLAFCLLIILSLSGCSGSDPPPSETVDAPVAEPGVILGETETEMLSTTEAGATSSEAASATGSTLNYIPSNAVSAVIVRPSKAMNNPMVMQLIALMDEANPNARVAENLKDFEEEVGVDPKKVDHLLIVVDEQSMSSATALAGVGGGGLPPTAPKPTVIVQLNSGVDAQTILDSVKDAKMIEITGGQGVETPDGGVLFKVSDSRLVYTSKDNLEAVLSNAADGTVKSMLAKSAASDFAIALDLAPVKTFLQTMMQIKPNPQMGMVMPMISQFNSIAIAADLEADQLLKIAVDTPNAEAAEGVQGMLTGYLGMGKQYYAGAKANIPPNMQAMTQELVDSAKLSAEETLISLTIPRPANFETLPELLKPMISQAATAGNRTQERNNMKMLGLAFHNYHSIYNHFPAVDANGAKDEARVKGKGLSWRVHLLPLLDESQLYNRFNLEEPWDSETNRVLISEMPALFGTNADGKTSMHVFIGETTPFGADRPGLRFRDLTDGTSNTILVVRSGEDTADIWTKPGGLTFKSDDPAAALGNIGETLTVLLADGAVREILTAIDKETLSNLIQHADRNPVDF